MKSSISTVWTIAMGTLFAVLVGLFIATAMYVEQFQNTARVINYTGIVRGAPQRLVKNELYGVPGDKEIARLDEILAGLRGEANTFNLTTLNDVDYNDKLNIVSESWSELKEDIYAAREDENQQDKLYTHSEEYFEKANHLVFSTEVYANQIAANVRRYERYIAFDLFLISLLLICRAVLLMHENKKLSSMAYLDSATGLPNKRRCEEYLLSDIRIESWENVCCFMFDLNNLKTVNDTLGHDSGDLLIKSFANLLYLVAPPSMFIGRSGGDEFIGVIEGQTKAELQPLFQKFEELSCMKYDDKLTPIPISFAFGYAHSMDHQKSTRKMLLELADQVMYKNKIELKKSPVYQERLAELYNYLRSHTR